MASYPLLYYGLLPSAVLWPFILLYMMASYSLIYYDLLPSAGLWSHTLFCTMASIFAILWPPTLCCSMDPTLCSTMASYILLYYGPPPSAVLWAPTLFCTMASYPLLYYRLLPSSVLWPPTLCCTTASYPLFETQSKFKILFMWKLRATVRTDSEVLHDCGRSWARLWSLLEPDVSVRGFPLPLLLAGLVYSVVLGLVFRASLIQVWQLLLLGDLFRL